MQAAMSALAGFGGEALIGAGAGLQMAGAVAGTAAAISAANYQRMVAQQNEIRAKQNAEAARAEAAVLAKRQDEEALLELGALAAKQGASGIRMGSGTPFLQRLSLEKLAKRDRSDIAQRGEDEAASFLQDASDFASEAVQARRTGMFSVLEGGLSFGTSAISGASSIIDYRRRTLGVT